jgi:hypothetical protein
MPPAGSFWEPQSRDLLPAISERPLMVQCLHEARQGKTHERAHRIPGRGKQPVMDCFVPGRIQKALERHADGFRGGCTAGRDGDAGDRMTARAARRAGN